MNIKLYILSCTILVTQVVSKRIGRCQLANLLKENGIPKSAIPDWVCLVEHESSSNTGQVGKPSCDGHKGYGIFQIDDRTWCSHKGFGKGCHLNCKSFLDDNIKDDIFCAKKIHNLLGFNAWRTWQNKCKGKTLPDLKKCSI